MKKLSFAYNVRNLIFLIISSLETLDLDYAQMINLNWDSKRSQRVLEPCWTHPHQSLAQECVSQDHSTSSCYYVHINTLLLNDELIHWKAHQKNINLSLKFKSFMKVLKSFTNDVDWD